MIPQRVLIVGNQLFANALSYLLAEDSGVIVVDSVPSIQACIRILEGRGVDTLIIAQALMQGDCSFCDMLSDFPETTVIKAHLENDQIEVITRQRLNARPKELLAALAGLPRVSD